MLLRNLPPGYANRGGRSLYFVRLRLRQSESFVSFPRRKPHMHFFAAGHGRKGEAHSYRLNIVPLRNNHPGLGGSRIYEVLNGCKRTRVEAVSYGGFAQCAVNIDLENRIGPAVPPERAVHCACIQHILQNVTRTGGVIFSERPSVLWILCQRDRHIRIRPV